MNPILEQLVEYPFERKRKLLAGITPSDPIDCTIGEPQHAPPELIEHTLSLALQRGIARYPPTKEDPSLTKAIRNWAHRTLSVPLDDTQILALGGSGEGLFSLPFVALNPTQKPLAVLPNPFYQVYEGGTLMAGGKVVYLNLTARHNFQPDFDSLDSNVWKDVGLLYINYPNNPTGANATRETLQRAVDIAQREDVIVASDECYFDIYATAQKPLSILEVAKDMGVTDYHNIIMFQSLSKRSSVPGLRSGFMAGDKNIIGKYLRLRMLERKAVPLHVQLASAEAWNEDAHVEKNRQLYADKIEDFHTIVPGDYTKTEGTFFVWFKVPNSFTSESFTKQLYQETGVAVLPGNYLSRENQGVNPGEGYVRIALVHSRERSQEAAERLKRFVER